MSSVFLSYKCQAQEQQPCAPSLIAWSKTENLLAVAYSDGKIRFFADEGRAVEDAVASAAKAVAAMEWQPKGRVLAVGTQNGVVSTWVWQEKAAAAMYSNHQVHTAAIAFVLWNPAGTRLVTGDKSGVLCVWKADVRGSLAPALQYKRASALTRAVFAIMPQHHLAAGNNNNKALSPSFFFGTDQGVVSYADDLGHCSDVQQSMGTAVDVLAFYEDRMRLVVITRSLFLSQLQVGDDGRVTPVMKVKLSIAGGALDKGVQEVAWAGPGLLATVTGESMVRFWDVANEENYALPLSSVGHGVSRSDQAVALAFNPLQRYLAVGTKEGKCILWSFRGEYRKGSSSADAGNDNDVCTTGPQDWEASAPTEMPQGEGAIRVLSWGPGKGVLAAVNGTATYILDETLMQRTLNDGVAVIQLNSDSVKVEHEEEGTYDIRTKINIKGMAASKRTVAFWNGKQAEVYELQPDAVVPIKSFATSATAMAIRADTLYRAVETKVEICNLQGVIRQTLAFTEAEGRPVLLDVNGNHMAVATDTGLLKIFDIKGREPKQVGSSGRFVDARTGDSLGVIRSIKCNADGTRVSILSDTLHGSLKIREPDMRLHIYDADRDVVVHHDFAQQKRYPVSHFWDPSEPKLIACETRRLRGMGALMSGTGAMSATGGMNSTIGSSNNSIGSSAAGRWGATGSVSAEGAVGSGAEVEVVTLLATADYGILMQDSFPLLPPLDALLGIQIPKLYFTAVLPRTPDESKAEGKKRAVGEEGPGEGGGEVTLMTRTMRDFMGLDELDDETRRALMDFSYYLTVRNMDEAYRAVKLIKNASVWENMAHMCVKTKRIDVAEICLGNMGHARGAAAVRAVKKSEAEVEAAVAMVAVQLGLVDEAANLYTEAWRYDLLNQLYQASGQWDRALEVAASHDRVHLRTTHFLYAKHLEALGDVRGAIHHYQVADAHRMEVPRMMLKLGRLQELEDYVLDADDPQLLRWWGSYCESQQQYDKARKLYFRAGDQLDVVRLCCHAQDVGAAEQVVNDTRDKAAAYHLARQFEANGDVHNAIKYYAQSECYNHSIRLAKRYGLDSELMSYALKSRESLMIDCASYFEDKDEYEKAVQLYHKGGDIPKALDLCFKAGSQGRTAMFDMLTTIAEGLGADTSPQVLSRCAEFFIDHGQFDKAVHLYILGHKYTAAIDLCVAQKVKITDELADRIAPEDGGAMDKAGTMMSAEERSEVLKHLAKACKQQGAWHLACKKYTQAGERVKALKCLLRSGDTKSIMYYASVSRNRDIFILAANYLQNLDWHTDAEIMKAIINFYTKAKAFEQLSGFYDACAQVEIDEYRDYDKAVGALREAAKHMAKARSANKDRVLGSLQQRIALVERFVQARDSAKANPADMVQTCHQLLDTPGIESAIRVGDCFALLVEFHYSQRDMREAYKLIQQMRERHIILNPYLEQEMVKDIHRTLNVPLPQEAAADEEEEDEDEVAEEDMGEEEEEEDPREKAAMLRRGPIGSREEGPLDEPLEEDEEDVDARYRK